MAGACSEEMWKE